MSEDKSKSTIKKSPFKWAIGAALIVWAVWLVNWAVLQNSTPDLRGTFGDMFGASNAIFSGLALVGLIYAIIQQQEQLDLAREELSTARSDLSETKKLSEEQSDHIDEQNRLARKRDFEATFFKLVEFNREDFAQKLDRKLMERVLSSFRNTLFASNPDELPYTTSGQRTQRTQRSHSRKTESVSQLFTVFFENHSDVLEVWDRSLWFVLEFVEDSEFLDIEKQFYVRVFRSRLNTVELVYISLSALADKKKRHIVSKYELFSSETDDESLEDIMHSELLQLYKKTGLS